MDERELYRIASELLHRLVEYWDGLSQERRNGYFHGDEMEITVDGFIEKVPVKMSLKVWRFDLSSPPRVCALASSNRVAVQITAFMFAADNLKWSEENVTLLVDTYKRVCKELRNELD